MMKGLLKIVLPIWAICLFWGNGYAQNAFTPAQPGISYINQDSVRKPMFSAASPAYKPKPVKIKQIRKELSFGIRLNTDGYSLFCDLGKVKAEDEKKSDMFHNVRIWQFEIEEKKDPRESKSSNVQPGAPATTATPSPYVYGKINNFYAVKIGLGIRRMIAGKPDPGSVSIHWVILGGVCAGLLKPYYVNSLYNGEVQAIKYSTQTANAFLDPNSITGSAGFGKGLGEIQFVPGIHLKTALHFDFASNRKTVLAVETGINAEAYTQGIQFLALQNSKSILFNLYASFQFGKRW
jgi:hypothetical protein